MANRKKRYVDVDLVKGALLGWDYDPSDEDLEWAIDNLPTADVVEVVRCKDCKHYCLSDYRKPNEPKWCDLSREQNEYPEPNDFCSYGERRENNG